MGVLAKRVSIAIQNNKLSLADISPLDAAGDALTELAGLYGIPRRAATAASGNMIVALTASTTVPAKYRTTLPGGLTYETTSAKTVGVTGEFVQVRCTTTGSDTDQAAGALGTWDSSAISTLDQNATVGLGGLDGGEDEDDDERLRNRLLRRLGLPAVGGNSSHVVGLAEDSTAAVEKAFAYPAARGAGSWDLAVTIADGDRTMSQVDLAVVASALFEMPGVMDMNVTSVSQQQMDVILDINAPLPIHAGGTGNGFRDAVPWPLSSDSLLGKITSIGGGTLTVQSDTAPVIGKRFGIWDPDGGVKGFGEMREFSILNVTGSGPYTITIDQANSDSMEFVVAGMYCSSGMFSLVAYAETFRGKLALLGPGEKTSNQDILPRAARFPKNEDEFPSRMSTRLLSAVENDHAEVSDLAYSFRYKTGTTTEIFVPDEPTTTADAPRIFTLKNLAIRRLV